MSDDGGPGLRERKKRETRMALSLAAVRLVVERGWDNVTIEDIAAAANVSDRTFRNYFASKAEAIASRHVDRTLLIAEELRSRPTAEPLWDAIVAAVIGQFGPVDGEPAPRRPGPDGLSLMLAQPALHGEIVKASVTAQAELGRAVAERTDTDPDRDLYPKLVAAAIGGAIGAAVEQCLRADERRPIAAVLVDALDQIRRGLPVP